MIRAAIPALVPAEYQAHELHRGARVWTESNCYVDLWIELLSTLGLEPRAMLAHMLDIDFEGDQWTFVKPCSEDLRRLYGLEIQELQIWDRFARHIVAQVSRGRLVLAEVDAFFLPDTAGVSYRTTHAKTTIAIERIGVEERRLGYFHNGGYFEAEGDDAVALLSPDQLLPPYVEIVKLDGLERLPPEELRRRSWELFSRNLARRPIDHPILRYAAEFAEHADWIRAGELDFFHTYAFASLRQCGAAHELLSCHLRWLAPTDAVLSAVAADFEAISLSSKAAMFKLARAAQHKRSADLGPLIEAAPRWQAAFERLRSRVLEPLAQVA